MEQITYGMAGRVYWAAFWRNFLISSFVAVLMTMLGLALNAPVLFYAIDLILKCVVSYIILRIVFNKEYATFSVTLVDNDSQEPMAKRWYNIFPLWWSMFWRMAIVVAILAGLFVFVMGASTNKEWEQSVLYSACQSHLRVMREGPAAAKTPLQAKNASAYYKRQNCENVLKQPAPKADIPSRSLAAVWLVNVFFPIFAIGTFFVAMIKIHQILLRKRYQKFHVRVLRYKVREGVVAT